MHIYHSLIPFIFSALVLVGCSKEPKDHLISGESHLSFTDNGAWCWFSDPRAIFYKGRTYAGWVDSLGNIIVGYYDHKTRYIETRVLHENLEVDDHDNPSLFIDRDGKLMVFYSKHSGSEPIYLLRATRAEDISQWEELDELKLNDTIAYQGLSDTYTYTNICQLADENDKLYLFWRGADYKPNVSVSMDNGKSWEAGKIFVLPERIYKDRRPYMKVASNDKDVIHFAFTDGHPNREFTNSIYYAKYKKGSFYKANGEKIADWSQLPLSPPLTDVAYDAKLTTEKAWIWDIAENKEGNPVLVYSRFPTDSAHVYYYSVWSENKWNHHELINSGHWFPETPAGKVEREPNYSGGIVLDHSDPSIVYLSVKRNGIFEIEKWTTGNNGKDWSIESITSNSKSNNVRPFVIRNHGAQDSPSVLWMNVEKYVHYTDYQTSIKMNVKNDLEVK
jgi:BNR repeat-containing family member